MPFIGLDWRSPGDGWIRTEFGWKRIADICNSPYVQLTRQIRRSLSPLSVISPRDLSKRNSANDDNVNEAKGKLTQASTRSKEERERHLKHLKRLLLQRCVSARTSSRESNHYSTISDAVNKLNFLQALQDENCFPFICKVVTLLFEQYYFSLSGSMQTTLLRISEEAKNIAMETRKHTSLVVKLIETAITALQKGRRHQFAGIAVRGTDTKIKSLLKMKRQLIELLNKPYGGPGDLCKLPDDCLRHIISHLSDPKDVLNLGQTAMKLHVLTKENWVWRKLTNYHYGNKLHPVASDHSLRDGGTVEMEEESGSTAQDGVDFAGDSGSWQAIFKQEFMLSKRKLRSDASHAACLCTCCNFVHWESYGHPCCANTAMGKEDHLQEPSSENLTPEQFIKLFVC